MRARISDGAAWVDTDLTGFVQYGGERVEFGPPAGGTVDEFFNFPTPANPDWADDPVNVGCVWATLTAGDWIGNRMWVAPSAGTVRTAAYNWDTQGVLIPSEVIGGGVGQYVSHLFASAVSVLPGVSYMAAMHTTRYGFTRPSEGAVTPFTTVQLYTSADMGAVSYYTYGPAGNLPTTSSPNFHFNVSPIVRFPA